MNVIAIIVLSGLHRTVAIWFPLIQLLQQTAGFVCLAVWVNVLEPSARGMLDGMFLYAGTFW